MAIRSFPYCAKRYSGSWSRNERPLFKGLADADRSRRLEALQRGAGYFKIARNFRTAFDVGEGSSVSHPC
jgi:hypothetical protein